VAQPKGFKSCRRGVLSQRRGTVFLVKEENSSQFLFPRDRKDRLTEKKVGFYLTAAKFTSLPNIASHLVATRVRFSRAKDFQRSFQGV